MNNSTILAIINGNYEKVNKYENTDEVQKQRKSLAGVLKAQNDIDSLELSRMPSSYQPSNQEFVSAIGKKMTDSELVEKGSRLEKAVKDGYLYYMDTETIAAPDEVMKDELSKEAWKDVKAGKQGEYHNVITELYMHKQKYENGKPVGAPEKVFEFADSISVGGLSHLDSYIRNTEGANDLSYVRERLAGYHQDGSVVDGVVKSWDGEADRLDDGIVSKGITNLGENAVRIGSAEHHTQMENVYNELKKIGESDNMALVTINGNNADMPWLEEAFNQAGVKYDKDVVYNGHVDAQRMIEQTAKDEVIKGQIAYANDLREQAKRADKQGNKDLASELETKANNVDTNITNSGIVNAARGRGADIEEGATLHLAKDDTILTQKGVENFIPDIVSATHDIDANMKTTVGDSSKKRIYKANRAIQMDKNDLFFTMDYNGTVNTYNPTVMEAGHSYKFSLLDPKEIDGFQNHKEVEGMKLLRIKDMATDVDRESYVFVDGKNTKEDIQKRFLDTGHIEMMNETTKSQEEIDTTTKNAMLDKARREKDSFFSVNSDRGYEAFERYYETYETYKAGVGDAASKEHFAASIKRGYIEGWGEKGETVAIDKALPQLFTQKPGFENSLIQERANYAVTMYDDFDKNHEYYKTLKDTVDSHTMSYAEFKDKYPMSNEYQTQRAYNQARTKVFNQAKESADDAMINKLSEDEIMNAYYENPYMMSKSQVDGFLEMKKAKQLKQNIHEARKADPNGNFTETSSQVQVTEVQMQDIKKNGFEELFGFEFDKDFDFVRNSVKGVKVEGFDLKSIHEMDILSADEGYTRIRTDSHENIQIDLNKRLNRIQANNRRGNANGRIKSIHVDNIAEDLNRRGLISDSELTKIRTANKWNPKATLLSEAIWKTKTQVESTAKTITGANNFAENVTARNVEDKTWEKVESGKITEEQAHQLNGFLENVHVVDPQRHPEGIETIAGVKKDDFINSRMGGTENLAKEIEPHVAAASENLVPTLVTDVHAEDSNDKMGKFLQSEFGWTQNNADIFMEGIVKNNNVQGLKYASGEKANLSHMIIKQDGNGYFITTTKEKQPRLHEMISNGADVEELKEHGIVYKLPKITEEYGGVRVMRQSKTAAKAVTKEIVLDRKKIDGENVAVFKQVDTMDEVLTSLRWGYEKATEAMVNKNMEKANSLMSNKRINENKSTSGTVTRAVEIDGKVNIIKTQKMSVADAMLGHKNKIGDLGIYSLDTVLQENDDLRQKLINKSSERYVDNLEEKIRKYKKDPFNNKKMAFGEHGAGVKVWFAQNSSEIADTLLKSEEFMAKHSDNEGVVNTLHAMKEYGATLFYGKDSGEASEGILNMIPTHLKVAGAHYSGGSRPLINQVLSALAVSENDALIYARKNLPGGEEKFKTINDVYEHIGFKPSRSFITESTLKDEKLAAAEGEHLAMSTRVKYSTPREFITKLNNIDDALANDSAMQRIKLALEKNGIKDASLKEIKEQARALGAVTNLYEDSSAIDPKFARVLGAKTVISEDVNGDLSRFNIGDTLTSGTVLSVDKHGKEVKYKGRDVTIVGVDKETGKLTAQQNTHYFDQKFGIGGSEKTEAHTPELHSAREVEIQHAVFQEVAGNIKNDGTIESAVNLITNPDIGKHEAWNSIFTNYSNAMVNNIKDQKDADFLNASFKKHFGDNIAYEARHEQLGKDSRWLLVEGKRKAGAEFDAFKAFENVISDIKRGNSDYSKNVSKEIEHYEKHGIGWSDLATMSDNTIENTAVWAEGFVKGGAKINHRSQSVIGIFIGDDPLEKITKYREELNGKLVTPLDALVKHDIDQMFNDKGFIKDMEQVSNIRTSLSMSMGDNVEGARIVDLKLSDVLTPGNRMSAVEIPTAYGMEHEINGVMQQVNGYRIKLDGMQIKNPIYEDLKRVDSQGKYVYEHLVPKGKFDPEAYAARMGIKEKVSEIYLPALDPNRLDEKFTLTEVQKKASDLFATLDDLNSSIKRGSFGEHTHADLVEKLHTQYSQYMQSMRHELVDKKGLYKSSLNVQAENSARLKVAKIAAPVLDKNGQYLDREYKNIATKMINGEVHYRGVVKVNPMTLFKSKAEMDQSFKNIGEQIIHDEKVDNSIEAFNFLKGHIENKLGGKVTTNNIDDLRAILKKSNLTEEDYHELGKNYLRDVGFNGRIMRDPAMLPTSYQTARIYTNDHVTAGTVSTDAVVAKWINGDGDGDEFNFYNYMFEKGKVGGFKLRQEDHEVAQAMAKDVQINEDSHMDMLHSITKDVSEANDKERKEFRRLEEYQKKIKLSRKEVFTNELGTFNPDYMFNEHTELTNLLSRFLKDAIGQVSNPNYYMRSAANFYASGRGLNVENLRMQRNMQILTKVTEQNLIDIKSVKGEEDANKLLRIATTYKSDIDALGNLEKTPEAHRRLRQSLSNLLEGTGEMLVKKGGIVEDLPENFLTDATVRDDMIGRIISGEYNRGKGDKISVEEIYGDAFKMMQNEEANKVFWSPTVRQTDLYSKNGHAIPEYEKNRRATGTSTEFNTGGHQLFDETGGRTFTSRAPMIEDRFLNRGDVIFSTNIDGKVSPGLYAVESTGRVRGQAMLNLTDLSSGESVVFKGKGFDEINENIKDFGVMSRHSDIQDIRNKQAEVENTLYNKYVDRFTSGVEGHDMAVAANTGSPTVNLNNKMSKRAVNEINLENNADLIGTVESLKQNKIITEAEGDSVLKEMNQHIRNTGTAGYREAKMNALLNTPSVKAMGVTKPVYSQFENKYFTDEMRESAMAASRYRSDLQKMQSVTRYDIDSLSEHFHDTINKASEHKNFKGIEAEAMESSKETVFHNMITKYAEEDKAAIEKFQEFFKKYSSNQDFQHEVLNLNFNKAIDLIKNNDHEGAMAMLGKTVISFGQYVGMSLDQLGKEQMKEVMSSDYLKHGADSGIHESVINETKNIINKMTEMDESDIMNVSINPKAPNEDLIRRKENDFITEARQKLNEDIKAKGATREKTENASAGMLKGMFNKAKTAFNEMSGTKKKLLAGGAMALAGIGAINMYQSGSRNLEGKDGDYTRNKSTDNSSNIKTHEVSHAGENYTSVPQSNHRFYASQNDGLSVKVRGQNPTGTSPHNLHDLVKNMMGGSDVKLNTSMNDSRKGVSDNDVDDAMSNVTGY
jgi:hypothetical protein